MRALDFGRLSFGKWPLTFGLQKNIKQGMQNIATLFFLLKNYILKFESRLMYSDLRIGVAEILEHTNVSESCSLSLPTAGRDYRSVYGVLRHYVLTSRA